MASGGHGERIAPHRGQRGGRRSSMGLEGRARRFGSAASPAVSPAGSPQHEPQALDLTPPAALGGWCQTGCLRETPKWPPHRIRTWSVLVIFGDQTSSTRVLAIHRSRTLPVLSPTRADAPRWNDLCRLRKFPDPSAALSRCPAYPASQGLRPPTDSGTSRKVTAQVSDPSQSSVSLSLFGGPHAARAKLPRCIPR